MLSSWVLVLIVAGCGPSPATVVPEPDGGLEPSRPDASALDSGQAPTVLDAGPEDAGASDAGPSNPVCGPEVCDGLDNDCDGVADEALSGCDPCEPRHELPVVTHWSNRTKRFEYLASDQPSVFAAYDASTPYAPGRCYHSYADGRLPDFDAYLADTWSTTSVSDETARSLLGAMCRASGVPVKLLRPDAFVSRAEGSGRLVSRPGAVQVLHAQVVEGSLVTVVLPPNWEAGAPSGTYPIVANAFYDQNENLFLHEGPDLVRMIALSGRDGRTGAIGLLWNGGGALASRTMNPNAPDEFARIVRRMADDFGADRHRILTYGGSRGGGSAITLASNPKRLDYRVTFAAPGVPPTRIGEHAQLQGVTFPMLMHAVTWSVGLDDAWRAGWTYPACAGRPNLTGKTGPQAHLHVLVGTTDFQEADEHLSPISDAYVAGLLAAGTQVYLEVGSHDFIVPYAHQVEYGRRLIEAGVPVHADVLVRAGHTQRPEAGVFGWTRTNRVWEALQVYVSPGRTGSPTVAAGVDYYRVDRATLRLEPFVPSDGQFPFTLEFPRYAVQGGRFPIVAVGAAGTRFRFAYAQGAAPPAVFEGEIPASMKRIHWVDVPAGFAGDFAASLEILKPGAQRWTVVPSTNTPDGSPALTTVVDEEPNLGGAQVSEIASAPRLPGYGTNWGLSEY